MMAVLHDRIKEHFGATPSLTRLPDLIGYLKTIYRDEGYTTPRCASPGPGINPVDLPCGATTVSLRCNIAVVAYAGHTNAYDDERRS